MRCLSPERGNVAIMENAELISIILPVYNTYVYLDRALSCLHNQTYRNTEVLIINDGSTDDSEKVCLSWAEKDIRFRYIYQENRGVSYARNVGIKAAKGEFITFVDSDDWVDEDYIEVMYDLLVNQQTDISIIMSHNYKKPNGERKPEVFSSGEALIALYEGILFDVGIPGKLFRRELFLNVRCPEKIAIAEDIITNAYLFRSANCVAFQAIEKYHITYNPNSATKMRWNPKVWSCVEAAKELYDIMKDFFPEKTAYGKKVACYTNLVIAQKLSGCGRLNQTNYIRVKNEILKYHSRDAEKVMGLRLKYELRIFLLSRRLYIFFRWLFKNKLAMKLRKLL